jgi:hypothetical protein
MRKRKPKPSEIEGLDVINLSEVNRILRVYRDWISQFPNVWNFTKAQANDVEFWGRAQAICRQYGLEPELILYVVYRYINSNPNDAEVRRFDPLIFRAPRLLQRSIFNFKTFLEREMNGQKDLHFLMYQQEYHPSGDVHTDLLKTAQSAAALLYYFLIFKDEERARNNQRPFTPEERDSLAYKMCDQNPFALLHNVSTPRIVALAEVNCYFLNHYGPWYQVIWQPTMPGNRNLSDIRTTCLQDPRPYFLGGNLGLCWPADPFSGQPYEKEPRPDPEPRLKLNCGVYDAKIDWYLEILANQARSRAGAPPRNS